MIAVQRVSKRYELYKRPGDRLLEALSFFGGRRHDDFWALKDVSLRVEPGEVVALIGPNGSGKSTLLQVVSGIIQPTSGRVLRKGRLAALLELGAGFNLEFTGRENVFLNGELLGLSKRQIQEAFPSIAAFAEIGEFMDRPVKEYSSGMYVRLAFSTAIHVDPEILLVDEALAVGDAIFASRCVQKFEELRQRGVTVLFVSHDLGLVKRLADRAVLMLQGRVAAEGAPADVVNQYVGLVLEREKRVEDTCAPERRLEAKHRHGDGASRIIDVALLNAEGSPVRLVRTGDPVTIRVRAEIRAAVEEPVAGILLRDRLRLDVYGTNTRIEGHRLGAFEPGEILEVYFRIPCLLTQQEYTLTAATQNWDGTSQDWLDDVLTFEVTGAPGVAGCVNLPAEVTFQRHSPIPARS